MALHGGLRGHGAVSLLLLLAAAAAPALSQNVAIVSGFVTEFNTLPTVGCRRAMAEFYGPGNDGRCQFILTNPSPVNMAYVRSVVADPQYAHVVFIGFYFETATYAMALEFRNKTFTMIDVGLDESQPQIAFLKQNVQGVVFAEDQSGFMAGVVAGLITSSFRVGIISGTPFAPLVRFVNGYFGGARYVCPSCQVFRVYVNSFDNATLGIAAADSLIQSGVDVIFGAGGSMGSAGILYASARGLYVIGVDANEALSTFAGAPDIQLSKVITSAEKRTDTAAYLSIIDRLRGVFSGGTRVVDASVGGLALSPCPNALACSVLSGLVPVTTSTSSSCAKTVLVDRQTRINSIFESIKARALKTGTTADGYFTTVSDQGADIDEWASVSLFGPAMPATKGHSATLARHNNILVFGGEVNGNPSSACHVLQFDTQEWAVCNATGAPSPRSLHSAVAHGNQVVVFGGRSGLVILSDVISYDMATSTWTTQPTNIALRRCEHAAAVQGNRMFVFGGSSGVVSDELWSLDLLSYTWTQVVTTGAIPRGTRGGALVGAANGTALYFYGGLFASGAYSSSLYALDTASAAWTALSPSDPFGVKPVGVAFFGAAFYGQVMAVLGGVTADGSAADTYYYATGANEWRRGRPLPSPTSALAAVAFRQTDDPAGCVYTPASYLSLCVMRNRLAIVRFGGLEVSGTAEASTSSDVDILYVGDAPLPGEPEVVAVTSSSKVWVVAVAVAVPVGTVCVALLLALFLVNKKRREMQGKALNWIVDPSEIVIGAEIGAGRFGTVHEAKFRGTRVAIKLLREKEEQDEQARSLVNTLTQGNSSKAGWTGGSVSMGRAISSIMKRGRSQSRMSEFERARALLILEIETMVTLRHPNIVQMLGASVDKRCPCIVLELMSASLDSLFDKGPDIYPWSTRLAYARDIALGMTYLHSAKPPVLHRDLKSMNVLIDYASNRVKVSDFGLAQFKVLKPTSSAMAARPVGSYLWMAPEIFSGEQYTEASDVYSYGVIMCELSTWTRPYAEQRGELILEILMVQVTSGSMRPKIAEGTPDAFASLAKQCMDNAPAVRPTFADIGEALANIAAK